MKNIKAAKTIVAMGEKLDRKALNRAKKTFQKSKGVEYALRVKNLNSGATEW